MGLSRSVLSPRCTTDHLLAALCHLLADPAWDVAHFNQLRPDSPLLLVLQQLESATVSPYPGDLCSRCPAVIIADLPRKVRADVLYHRMAAAITRASEIDPAECRAVARSHFPLSHMVDQYIDLYTHWISSRTSTQASADR